MSVKCSISELLEKNRYSVGCGQSWTKRFTASARRSLKTADYQLFMNSVPLVWIFKRLCVSSILQGWSIYQQLPAHFSFVPISIVCGARIHGSREYVCELLRRAGFGTACSALPISDSMLNYWCTIWKSLYFCQSKMRYVPLDVKNDIKIGKHPSVKIIDFDIGGFELESQFVSKRIVNENSLGKLAKLAWEPA